MYVYEGQEQQVLWDSNVDKSQEEGADMRW
jgi:hypothetical protein